MNCWNYRIKTGSNHVIFANTLIDHQIYENKKLTTCIIVCVFIVHLFIVFCSSMHIWQTFNALFIIRCTVKYLIETGSEYQLLQHFEAMPTQTNAPTTDDTSNGDANASTENQSKPVRTVDGSKFETFFDAVVNLLIIIPVKYA